MRIDVYLFEKGFCKSRTKASEAIAEGRVFIDGKPVTKASFPVEESSVVEVLQPEMQFVSRAGWKLEKAFSVFPVDVSGKVVLDIGASTGGFTECSLRHGASYVYALDVGTGQLDESLRANPLVCNMEGINARYITKDTFDKPISVIVTDVSFISQKLLYPAVSDILPSGGVFISLIKPQFEVGRSRIGKNGIVKDPDGKLFRSILKELTLAAQAYHLDFQSYEDSPIKGGDGNREYLAYFIKH